MLTNSVSCKWCGHDGATLAANASHYIVDKPHPTHPAVLVVVVRRHVESPFELTAQEWADLARSLPWPAPVWRGTNRTASRSAGMSAPLAACIWRSGFRYKKAGVVCLDLHPAGKVQAGLFHAPDPPARQELMASLDSLNHRYGRGTVAFAASGIRKAWKLRSEQKSPAYTTRGDELLTV